MKHAADTLTPQKFTLVFIIATIVKLLMSIKMTWKEALRIFNRIIEIHNHLINHRDREAFFEMGSITAELAQIIRIDQVSFNPTVKENEEG